MKSKQTHRRAFLFAGVIALICIALTVAVVATVVAGYRADHAQRMTESVLGLVGHLQDRIALYSRGLHGTRGMIDAVGLENLDLAAFNRYGANRSVEKEFPGARGFGFIQLVRRDEVDAFVGREKSGGRSAFKVKELATHDGDRMIIRYINPEEGNASAIGLDIASEEHRRQAAVIAGQTGNATLTGPITLVQASGARMRGVLFLLPVYRPGADLSDAEKRSAALLGWSYMPLVVDDVLKNLPISTESLSYSISDSESGIDVYRSSNASYSSDLTISQSFELFGRTWVLNASPSERFFAADGRQVAPHWFAIIGLALSLSLSFIAFQAVGRRARQQAMAKEAEELTNAIVDTSPWSIIVTGENGTIVKVNASAAKIFGYTEQELIGQTVEQLIPHDLRDNHRQFRLTFDGVARSMAQGRPLTALRKDGSAFKAQIQIIAQSVGTKKYVLTSLMDVTASEEAKEVLAETKQRWQTLANSLPQMVWTCNADGECDFLSEQWVSYTGIPEEPQLTFGWLEQVHPEDRARLCDTWNRAVAELSVFQIEFRIRRHDGAYRWFFTRAVPFVKDGRLLRWYGSNTDIEDRKQDELEIAALLATRDQEVEIRTRELQNAQRDLSSIVDAIPSMIGYWTRDFTNRFANHAYKSWFGVDGKDIAGMNIRDLLGEEVFQKNLPYMMEVLKGKPQRFERTLTKADGSTSHVQAHYLPDNHNSETVGFYVLVFDVTDLKNSEESLRRAKLVAEDATNAKSLFLTSMSHELRTPMNGIVGFTDLLTTESFGPLNEKQREFAGYIKKSGEHLLSLMNDVLELSKVESGQLMVSLEPVEVGTVITAAVSTLQPLADRNNINLENTSKRMSLGRVQADMTRLKQCLINLGSNAIKYNRPGGSVRFSASKVDHSKLRITIEDTGMGIDETRQAELFQPFNRLGAEHSAIEGTGIGLVLVKNLVLLMGGEIGFTSRVKSGSTFWIDLPTVDVIEEPSTSTIDNDQLVEFPTFARKLKVLYVEDNEQNLLLMKNYLSLLPEVELLTAGDGVQALGVVDAQRLDLIILDINLPGMNGYEVLCEIRKRPGMARIKTVALTANAMSDQAKKGMVAGFDQYLTKPARLNSIMELIATTGRHAGVVELAAGER